MFFCFRQKLSSSYQTKKRIFFSILSILSCSQNPNVPRVSYFAFGLLLCASLKLTKRFYLLCLFFIEATKTAKPCLRATESTHSCIIKIIGQVASRCLHCITTGWVLPFNFMFARRTNTDANSSDNARGICIIFSCSLWRVKIVLETWEVLDCDWFHWSLQK